MATKKRLSDIKIKKGALSRQLGIPEEKNIPMALLNKIMSSDEGKNIKHGSKNVKVTKLLKQRANLAITYKKISKKK